MSSTADLERMVEEKREEGIYLTVLGFGMGNYKDSRLETLADKGNGNYAYIDNLLEGKKVLGKELWGNLYTAAKDVKLQIEFNPATVREYRLIGYENRLLAREDFNDDTEEESRLASTRIDENAIWREWAACDDDFKFASAVVEFGMLLRDSPYKGTASWASAMERARTAKGTDSEGYRAEFIKLVEMAELLKKK